MSKDLGGKPVVLVILDGWGVSDVWEGNAIAQARTPNMDRYLASFPNTTLKASGEAVGLPAGQMGSSETGHLTLGAGRVVFQSLVKINRSIGSGDFFKNDVLLKALDTVKVSGGGLHLFGLLSDGGVHSHINHIMAIIDAAKNAGIDDVWLHAFLDGRDTPPACAEKYLAEMEEKFRDNPKGGIATVMGRYYGMDRDKRWERTELAYRCQVSGEGKPFRSSIETLEHAYKGDETDEFVSPSIIVGEDGAPLRLVKDGDVVLFFNFRPDRARQLTSVYRDDSFDMFDASGKPTLAGYFSMCDYSQGLNIPALFPHMDVVNTLGEIASQAGMPQLRIAETEKFSHVTSFFSGERVEPFPLEERVLVPSPKVATYDLQPEMSAKEVTKKALERIGGGKFPLIVLNFANSDMVGHTGIMEAAKNAVKTVDTCLGKVVEEVLSGDGVCLVTADHGNAEQMAYPDTGKPHTAHTTNPVPFVLVCERHCPLRENGELSDVAPTILDILGLDRPAEMSGRSLLKR